jgi:hypothetical protein
MAEIVVVTGLCKSGVAAVLLMGFGWLRRYDGSRQWMDHGS